jgi:hypothetical protein
MVMKTREYSLLERRLRDLLIDKTDLSRSAIDALCQSIWNSGFTTGKAQGYFQGYDEAKAGEANAKG